MEVAEQEKSLVARCCLSISVDGKDEARKVHVRLDGAMRGAGMNQHNL